MRAEHGPRWPQICARHSDARPGTVLYGVAGARLHPRNGERQPASWLNPAHTPRPATALYGGARREGRKTSSVGESAPSVRPGGGTAQCRPENIPPPTKAVRHTEVPHGEGPALTSKRRTRGL
jgi:hypothetical protein